MSESTPACYAFLRETPEDRVLVVINPNPVQVCVKINLDAQNWKGGELIHDLLRPKIGYAIANHALELKLIPWGGAWLG
jgi:hypothetical protein